MEYDYALYVILIVVILAIAFFGIIPFTVAIGLMFVLLIGYVVFVIITNTGHSKK